MAGTATLMALKASSDAKSAEDRMAADRHRAILVLIASHLLEHGCTESAAAVQREGGAPLNRFEAADNIDLFSIVREYEAFYELKIGRKPKLTRRCSGVESDDRAKENRSDVRRRRPGGGTISGSSQVRAGGNASTHGLTTDQKEKFTAAGAVASASSHRCWDGAVTAGFGSSAPRETLPVPHAGTTMDGARESERDFAIAGNSIALGSATTDQDQTTSSCCLPEGRREQRPLKPLPFAGDPELRALASTITRDIFISNPNVRWGDVVSLHGAKRLLKEAVVMPLKYPHLFSGLLSPWQGILLYGPPGTGKTMLAKAVATECHTTFFNISASSIVSKYRGDSEKLVRVLFELARYHAPSTIFLDEIDAIMAQRGGLGGDSEHEGSRRMKTELLIQMDGLAKQTTPGCEDEGLDAGGRGFVFVLAASNIPWELDVALLRRLEKRVLVSLPDEAARVVMLEKLLIGKQPCDNPEDSGCRSESDAVAQRRRHPPQQPPPPPSQSSSISAYHHLQHVVSPDVDLRVVAQRTGGFSGSDIRLLCKEVAMKPIRRLIARLETLEASDQNGPDVERSQSGNIAGGLMGGCSTVTQERIAVELSSDPITSADIDEALATTRPTAQKFGQRYVDWQRDFGAS